MRYYLTNPVQKEDAQVNYLLQRSKKRRPKTRISAAFVGVLFVFCLMFASFRIQSLPFLQGGTKAVNPAHTVTHHAPVSPPSLPPLTGVAWHQSGQAAIMIDGKIVGQFGQSTPIPIASITKIMTALIVLQKYPLEPNASGSTYTVTPQDVV